MIPNLVDLPLEKCNVYCLTADLINSSQISPGKGIFVIDIPSSDIAPHQANDSRYYARIAGKSRPINHRFVLDIIGRAKHPKFIMEVELLSNKKGRNTSHQEASALVVRAYCRNIGKIYANYVNGWIYLPNAIVTDYERKKIINGKEYSSFYFENVHKDMVGEQIREKSMGYGSNFRTIPIQKPLYVTRFDPVLPSRAFYVLTEKLSISTFEQLMDFAEEEIHWEIYADNAPAETHYIKIKELLDGYEKATNKD